MRFPALRPHPCKLPNVQILRRDRELDKKTRALAILLRDDWATTAVKREQEARAARLQLAQAEADLAAQTDSMARLAVSSGRRRREDGEASRRPQRHAGGRSSVDGIEAEEPRAAREEAEVFLGGAGGGVEMVALQVGVGGVSFYRPVCLSFL